MERQAGPDGERHYFPSEVYQAAAEALDLAQRADLLRTLPPGHWRLRAILPAVAGLNPDLYQHLLRRKDMRDHHLDPLRCEQVSAGWAELAIRAVQAGYALAEVSRCGGRGGVFTGGRATRYQKVAEDWLALRDHPDGRVRRMADIGRRYNLDLAKEMAEHDRLDRRVRDDL